MTIPARTTAAEWFKLADHLEPNDPIAATTTELDNFWAITRVSELKWRPDRPDLGFVELIPDTTPRPTDGVTILGHPVVEISDWPNWMP